MSSFQTEITPQLLTLFETLFSVQLTDETNRIRDVLSQLDAQLFRSYTKPHSARIAATIEAGIKSIALKHDKETKAILTGLAAVQLGLLAATGVAAGMGPVYFVGTLGSAAVEFTSAGIERKDFIRRGILPHGNPACADRQVQPFAAIGDLLL